MLNFHIKFTDKFILYNYLFSLLNLRFKLDLKFIYKFKFLTRINTNSLSRIKKYNIEGNNDFEIILTKSKKLPTICTLTTFDFRVVCILKYNYLNSNIFIFFYNIFLLNLTNYISKTSIAHKLFSDPYLLLTKTRRSSILMLNYKFIDHKRYFNIIFKDLTYNILNTLSIQTLLWQRYGIGYKISNLLCNYLGISNRFKLANLPISTHYSKLSTFFSNNLDNLDTKLMHFNLNKHTDAIQLKTYKGFRLLKGYPTNGQRTRSNHKTAQYKPYKFSFYYV